MIMRVAFPLFFLLLFSLLHYQCSDSINVPQIENNLIHNPSFEENGESSLADWFVKMPSVVNFTRDIPPNGGRWALTIDVLWGSGNDVITTVKIPEGTHIYKFSFWSKFSNKPGFADIDVVARDSLSQISRINIDSESWKNYSILDTIASFSGDSLQITLSGGFSNISPGKTYFDLCTLELLE
jgi:hypothetical protein